LPINDAPEVPAMPKALMKLPRTNHPAQLRSPGVRKIADFAALTRNPVALHDVGSAEEPG
jgi:hypothetical protein